MIERLLDGLFWIGTAFTKSRHLEIEEFRQKQRVLILGSAVAVGGMLLVLLVIPADQASSSLYAPFVASVLEPFALVLAGISVLACLVAMWAAYCLSKYDAGFQ